MKKKFLALLVCTVAACVFAQDKVEKIYYPSTPVGERIAGREGELPPLDQWSCFQVGIAPGFPSNTMNSNVYGLKLGLPSSGGNGRVWGTEIAIFSSTTRHMKGFQTSVFANVCDFLDGVQAGLVNIAHATADGIQIGLVNYADECGFQIGLVNIIPKGTIPFLPIINFQFEPQKEIYIQNEPEE